MRTLARALAIATIALGLIASPATAGVIQEKTLTAKAGAQTWESTDRGSSVYVHVERGGVEITQHYVNRCRGSYVDRAGGLYVWVRIKVCGAETPQPFVVRYLSTAGPQRFTVRLTTGPRGAF